jgi:hypothetical protein
MLVDLVPLLGAFVVLLVLVASRTRRAWRLAQDDLRVSRGAAGPPPADTDAGS